MARVFFGVTGICYSLAAGAQSIGKLKLRPALPEAGKPVKFSYNGLLSGDADTKAVVYFFVNDTLYAQPVRIPGRSNGITGEISLPDAAKAFALVFKRGVVTDSNDNKGFVYNMHRAGKPVAGAHYSSAYFYERNAYQAGIKTNWQKALDLKEQEFAAYPASRAKYRLDHLHTLAAAKGKREAKEQLAGLVTDYLSGNSTEKELQQLRDLARVVAGQPLADSIHRLITDRYPHRETAIVEKIQALYNEKSPDTVYRKMIALKAANPGVDFTTGILAAYYNDNFSVAAERAVSETDLAAFRHYIRQISNPRVLGNSYHAMATKLYENKRDLPEALHLSAQSLAALEQLRAAKPAAFLADDWQREMDGLYARYGDLHALLLARSGRLDEAENTWRKIVAADATQPGVNQHYVQLLYDRGRLAEARSEAARFIREGYAGQRICELLKNIYLKEGGTEEGYVTELSQLMAQGFKKRSTEMKMQMLAEPAKDFSLQEMDGQMVSLAALKGKTVVVDFWANWCVPCKAAFGGMKQAVEKYKGDSSVVFLFINTLEPDSLKTRKDRTTAFMKAHNYSFRILFDEPLGKDAYHVMSDFRHLATGIPAKFVIDPGGVVRFRSVGYDGNAENLVRELSLMIEVARSMPVAN